MLEGSHKIIWFQLMFLTFQNKKNFTLFFQLPGCGKENQIVQHWIILADNSEQVTGVHVNKYLLFDVFKVFD